MGYQRTEYNVIINGPQRFAQREAAELLVAEINEKLSPALQARVQPTEVVWPEGITPQWAKED